MLTSYKNPVHVNAWTTITEEEPMIQVDTMMTSIVAPFCENSDVSMSFEKQKRGWGWLANMTSKQHGSSLGVTVSNPQLWSLLH